jgi:hypothetical protein
MQQQRPAPSLRLALEQIGAWVLDQPMPPPLEGQCCDRLRPTQIQRELLQCLEASGLGLNDLVDWRWDAQQGHVKGWLWQAGALQRFRWWRQSGQLSLHEQLRCMNTTPLHALP